MDLGLRSRLIGLGRAFAHEPHDGRDVDGFELHVFRFELGARHTAQDFFAALERLGCRRPVFVLVEVLGAREARKLKLGGVEWCGEFMGKAGR